MSFSGGKREAMNLLYQLIICSVTHGSSSTHSWDMGPGEALACQSLACSGSSEAPNGARNKTLATYGIVSYSLHHV